MVYLGNCPNCGAPADPTHNICPYCGTHRCVEAKSAEKLSIFDLNILTPNEARRLLGLPEIKED